MEFVQMGSHSLALFSHLLRDLRHLFDEDTIALVRNGNVEPWPDISLAQHAGLNLINSFYKKNVDMVDEDADRSALAKFQSVNDRLKSWELSFRDSWDEILFGELKRTVYDFFYPNGMPLISCTESILDKAACGPGSSIGSPGGDFYSKLFSGTLDCTNKGLYRAYRAYIKGFPRWNDAELNRCFQKGEANICEGNRLRFVPKKRDISRTICIEPTLNMWYQLGIGRILEARLTAFFGIDIGVQPDINRELCRRGSVDDGFATIDLESASDSLGLRMLELVIPADQLAYFLLTRSPSCELPSGERLALNMVSTMGNGYTFPLQTMLFASIITASARARGFHLVRPRTDSDCTYGVFGDDMVIPTGCHYDDYRKIFVDYGDVLVRDSLRLLGLLGFVVNDRKSYLVGPFRESCGLDSFRGHDVRGVYLKTLKTPQDRYVAINLLNRWSGKTGIPLRRTVSFLSKFVAPLRVPLWEADDSGIRTPLSLVRPKVSKKYHGTFMYEVFVSQPRSFRVTEDSTSNRRWIFNPDGLLLAFLRGDIRRGRVAVRNDSRMLYRKRFRLAPSWEVPPPLDEALSMAENPKCFFGGPRLPDTRGVTLEYQKVGAALNR